MESCNSGKAALFHTRVHSLASRVPACRGKLPACASLPQPSRHLDESLSDSQRLAHPLPTWHWQGLTNHVFAHMRHGVELLLADLAGELLLRVAMHDLVVLMQGPELLEGFATRYAL